MVKYRLNYSDDNNTKWTIDFDTSYYLGQPIPVRSVGGQAGVLTHSNSSDDPYYPIINCSLSVTLFNQNNIDVLELQNARDKDFVVSQYREGLLYFRGYMIADGIQRPLQSDPTEIKLNITDGLGLLEKIPYTHTELDGGNCIINYLRDILYNNLGIVLPIQWAVDIKCTAFPMEDDVFSGSVRWSDKGEGYNDFNGTIKPCMYILENFMKSLQCRLYQSNGKWVIERVNYVADGVYNYRTCDPTLGFLNITETAGFNAMKSIGSQSVTSDYKFIDEDQLIMINPGVNRVVATYNQEQRENIIPNGSFDIVDVTIGQPIYWVTQGNSSATITSTPSLYERAGKSVLVINFADGGGVVYFMLQGSLGVDNGLPIDTYKLYDSVNLGFKFAISQGAILDGDGYIDWTASNFRFRVLYTNGTNIYALNENGFWSDILGFITVLIDKPVKLDEVVQIDFNAKQDILMPQPIAELIAGDTSNILIQFEVNEGWEVYYDDVYINVDSNSDVYQAEITGSDFTDKVDIDLRISSSFNGFYLSNFMTAFYNSDDEFEFTDGMFTGSLTALTAHAQLRDKYLTSQVFNGSFKTNGSPYAFGEMYFIQSLDDKKFIPLSCVYNTERTSVNMVACEVRNDEISATVTHYGSNSQTKLSN